MCKGKFDIQIKRNRSKIKGTEVFMTKKFLSIFSIFMMSTSLFSQVKAVKAPFSKGVNMTGWFEIWEKGIPNLNKYSYEDFQHLKELGVDVVRLPVHFFMMMNDETGELEEIVWTYLDKVCDWAEELKIHLIIDNHSFNSNPYPSAKTVKNHLEKIWPQIADRYKNRSDYILYEILNEPRLPQIQWEKIQKETLSLIRKYDTKHTVIVTGTDWGSRDSMLKLEPLSDDNLIYTFHFYDPFYFSHQGAEWSDAPVAALRDIPFPYDKAKMPKLQGAAKGSYLEQIFQQSYPKEANEKTMRENLQKAVDFSVKNNVPLLVGEFGVYNKYANYEDRCAWYETAGKLFQEFGLPYTIWTYDGSFSFFKKDNTEYPSGLEPRILKALDFNIPSGAGTGSENATPSSSQNLPLVLYDDLIGQNFVTNAWSSNKKAVMSSKKGECPQGKYYYLLSNLNRYDGLIFNFNNKDLTSASDLENTYLHFYIKIESKTKILQIRFIEPDTKENIPWRFAYDFPVEECTPGEWKLFEIPLSKFKITGAWSNLDGGKWYNAEPDTTFDWSNVDGLVFALEYADLKDNIFLDDIKIIKK